MPKLTDLPAPKPMPVNQVVAVRDDQVTDYAARLGMTMGIDQDWGTQGQHRHVAIAHVVSELECRILLGVKREGCHRMHPAETVAMEMDNLDALAWSHAVFMGRKVA